MESTGFLARVREGFLSLALRVQKSILAPSGSSLPDAYDTFVYLLESGICANPSVSFRVLSRMCRAYPIELDRYAKNLTGKSARALYGQYRRQARKEGTVSPSTFDLIR